MIKSPNIDPTSKQGFLDSCLSIMWKNSSTTTTYRREHRHYQQHHIIIMKKVGNKVVFVTKYKP